MAYAYESVRKRVEAMVTAWHHLPVSSTGSKPEVPAVFFRRLLSKAVITEKVIAHALQSVVPRRPLVLCRSQYDWKVTCDRRITRALQFVRCLADDAFVFGYRRFNEDELVIQTIRWLVYDWCGVGIKQVKTHLVWLSGLGRGVAAPTEGLLDKPGLVLSYPYLRWLKAKLSSRLEPVEPKFACLGQAMKRFDRLVAEIVSETCLLGTKRGFPSEEDDMVAVAGQAYAKQMSVDLPMEVDPVLRGRVIGAIQYTAREVFGYTDQVDFKPYQPSRRAGFEAPIVQGGILGALLRSGVARVRRELVRMLHWGTEVLEVYADILDSREVYENMLRKWGSFGCDGIADCQVYFIREPLKLRTITAGTPDLYGGLYPFFKHLRRGMKRFNCFSLTRGVSDGSIVADAMNRHPINPEYRRIGTELWDHFVSGDFQQSTNDLAMWATSAALDAIFYGRARLIARRALGAQRIHISASTEEEEDIVFEQARGQLMGSPLSFPILCVINAALARLAYQLHHEELADVRLDDLPILINGDDFLARMSRDIYDTWVKLIRVVGWQLSPGKSYFLRNYAQINSETRTVSRLFDLSDGRTALGKEITYHFSEPIPFVNGGSLQQMKKTTMQIDRSSIATMSLDWKSRYDDMARLPQPMCERARYVMGRNLDSLLQDLFISGRTPFLLNRTNPASMGGLGIGDADLDFQRCWYGLHAKLPTAEALMLRARVDEPITRKPTWKEKKEIQKTFKEVVQEPLLVWRRTDPSSDEPIEPGPLDMTKLLDMLVEDVERYVSGRPDPKAGLPVVYLDPTCNTVAVNCGNGYSSRS